MSRPGPFIAAHSRLPRAPAVEFDGLRVRGWGHARLATVVLVDRFVAARVWAHVRLADPLLAVHQRYSGLCKRRMRGLDRKSTRLNSSHSQISYAVFCLKKKKKTKKINTTTEQHNTMKMS